MRVASLVAGPRDGQYLSIFVYWTLAVGVTAFVALTTTFRYEVAAADAWEHHRAIRVVAQLGVRPGNPTYATGEPSIRYSPYTLALAVVVRTMHWDAWDVLSGAAVVNTALLMVALYVLLCAFRQRAAAPAVLLVALFLYGSTPGYANTLALEDLPWHQVNPSALSLALCILAWAAWRWAASSTRRTLAVAPLVVAALALSLLDHGMTGALGGVGLVAVALAERGAARARLLVGTAAVGVVAMGICALWPYYPFVQAIHTNQDPEYWYNSSILKLMLTNWCLPCLIASLLAIPHRREPLVEFGLWGLALTTLLTLFAVITRSATFARLPLAGLIFAQLLTGYVLATWHLFSSPTWRETFGRLRSSSPDTFVPGFVRLLLPFLILLFGVPQIRDTLRLPHLMRPRIARWLGRPDRQSHRFDRYAAILGPVGERDVVMTDVITAWPVPSFKGRIVGAEHFEYFTLDQQRRRDDASLFMTPGTSFETRARLLEHYDARWILLDRDNNATVLPELLAVQAVERDKGNMILMDARRWLAARQGASSGVDCK